MWDYSILLRSGRWLNILDSFRFAYLFCCCTASRIYCVANKRVLLSSGLRAALNWLCPSLLFVVIIRYWLRPLQSSANVRWCVAIRIDMHFFCGRFHHSTLKLFIFNVPRVGWNDSKYIVSDRRFSFFIHVCTMYTANRSAAHSRLCDDQQKLRQCQLFVSVF